MIAFRTIGNEGDSYDGEWIVELSKDEVIEALIGWEPAVQELLQVTRPTAINNFKRLNFIHTRHARLSPVGPSTSSNPSHAASGTVSSCSEMR